MHKYTLAPESTASRNSQNKPPCDVEKIEFERLERNNEFQLGRAPLRWTRQANTGLPAFLLETEKMKSQQESRERKNPAEARCRGCAGTRGVVPRPMFRVLSPSRAPPFASGPVRCGIENQILEAVQHLKIQF